MRVTRSLAVAAMLISVAASTASGAVKTREIEYKQEGTGTPLKGLIAWDDAQPGKRPGILVVHEWWGLNEHARNSARKLAEAGYVGLALDMYGSGKSTETRSDAEAMMHAAMQDPKQVAARFNAALAQLKQDPHVDPTKLGAIGYCMGGAIVLNMARAGADLAGVVSFHGILATQTPMQKGAFKGRVAVFAGRRDPFVPVADVENLRKEMTAAGVPVDIKVYDAMHGFTNPNAGKYGMKELEYNAAARRQCFIPHGEDGVPWKSET
jgi:dienelactone hydrolase